MAMISPSLSTLERGLTPDPDLERGLTPDPDLERGLRGRGTQ